jgi:hypothetical protein
MAGEGGSSLPGLPVPAGCRALRGAETDLWCSVDLACGATTESISCYHTASGPWQCSCSPPKQTTYLIDGASGLDACAIGAGLCSRASPALDIDSCVASKEEVSTGALPGTAEGGTCTLELSCQTPVDVDFAPGVRVLTPGAGAVRCEEAFFGVPQTEQRRVKCEATGTGGPKTYAVAARDVAEACRPVLEFHLAAQEPRFDGPAACLHEAAEYGAPRSCHLTETCFDTEPLSNGVSLLRDVSSREVGCGLDDFDRLACSCSLRGETDVPEAWEDFSAGLGPAPEPATCDFSRCTPGILAEATGPGECRTQLYTLRFEEAWCTDAFACDQPAILNGQSVSMQSWLRVYCARATDPTFYCACGAGEEIATFSVGALPDSRDACEMARTGCLEHVSLPLGPSPRVPPELPNPVPGM